MRPEASSRWRRVWTPAARAQNDAFSAAMAARPSFSLSLLSNAAEEAPTPTLVAVLLRELLSASDNVRSAVSTAASASPHSASVVARPIKVLGMTVIASRRTALVSSSPSTDETSPDDDEAPRLCWTAE